MRKLATLTLSSIVIVLLLFYHSMLKQHLWKSTIFKNVENDSSSYSNTINFVSKLASNVPSKHLNNKYRENESHMDSDNGIIKPFQTTLGSVKFTTTETIRSKFTTTNPKQSGDHIDEVTKSEMKTRNEINEVFRDSYINGGDIDGTNRGLENDNDRAITGVNDNDRDIYTAINDASKEDYHVDDHGNNNGIAGIHREIIGVNIDNKQNALNSDVGDDVDREFNDEINYGRESNGVVENGQKANRASTGGKISGIDNIDGDISGFADITKKNDRVFRKEHISLSDRCKKLLNKYLNKYLDELLVNMLLEECFGNREESTNLLFDKDFLRKHLGKIDCQKRKLRYLANYEPLVALASFPGSGNTWTRVLLEGLTGVYTGSLYPDHMAHLQGSKRCPTKGGVFIVKTHKALDLVKRKGCPKSTFSRAIFILRNPYDAIMAEFNRMKGGKVGFAHKEAFKSNNWRKYEKMSATWKKMAYFWMKQYKKPVHVLVYEDMKDNTTFEMYKLAKFLNVNVTLKTLHCLVNKPHEKYYRAVKPDWMVKSKLFDKSYIAKINADIRFLREQFKNQDIFQKYIL